MAEGAFFTEEAKARATKAVQDVEAQTSAEVVIALRRLSGGYAGSDYLAGAIVAFVALLALLFLPQPFPIASFPLDVALAFGFGVLISRTVPWVRRLLTSRRTMAENVRVHSLASFVELGIAQTSLRNGILVYVSMFERRAEVVPDIGIDLEALNDPWKEVVARIARAVAKRDYDAFLEAVRALGPLLSRDMPRADDDVNELPDQVQ